MAQINLMEKIKNFIEQGEFQIALHLVDLALDNSRDGIKELIDLKGELLYELGRYEQGIALYKNSMVYDLISSKDVKSFEILSRLHGKMGNPLFSQAYMFQVNMLRLSADECKELVSPVDDELSVLHGVIEKTVQDYYVLASCYVKRLQVVEACVYHRLYEVLGGAEKEIAHFIGDYQYVQRFYDQLKDKEQTYCVLEDIPLAKALGLLGKQVFVIVASVDIEDCSLDDVMKQSTIEGNIHYLRVPTSLAVDGLLVRLREVYCKEDSWILIGEQRLLKDFSQNITFYKATQKLYFNNAKRVIGCCGAMFLGNYLYTAKKMYGFDVPNQMAKAPEVKISIVVPTRSCTYTLKDTLRSCIEQRFDNYEIIVSDNSEEGYTKTYALVQELNSPKIKYYKTPYSLSLAKSFEYAYLRTNGEFIFSIGADDGVLPYGTELLSSVLDEYPDENIIQWNRLFYIWPESVDSGQADIFMFPTNLVKGGIKASAYSSDAHMTHVIQQINKRATEIYGLPLLYINSGMRRRHLLEMLQVTGKLIDGHSQDVFSGVLTLSMYDTILHLENPITIAGMSANSIGMSTTKASKGLVEYKKFVELNNNCIEYTELPSTPTQALVYPQYDYQLFVHELVKMHDLGIHPKCTRWKELVDFKNLQEWWFYHSLSHKHVYLDFVELSREYAGRQGAEISTWYETLLPLYQTKVWGTPAPPDTTKRYKKGLGGTWLTIDSSEFNVRNVFDASQFFAKLFDL